jgi:hypothetical protein
LAKTGNHNKEGSPEWPSYVVKDRYLELGEMATVTVGGSMKKLILIPATAGLLLLTSSLAPSYAQPAANPDTPTFYHLVPGTYVNGWPRFTVHYPKEWIELRPGPVQLFRAGAPGPARYPMLAVAAWSPGPPSLEKFVDMMLPLFRTMGTDVTIVSDKPSRLRDGTPARELEAQLVMNGAPLDHVDLATKKGDLWIILSMSSLGGKIDEDLKAFLYSIEFQPGFDEPVKLPPDVQAFIDEHDSDYLSHDLEKVMTHYSDGFLNSGVRKGEREKFVKQALGIVTSAQGHITEFVPAGDRAYLTGFVALNGARFTITETSIIKENGAWRWYGNQREVVP